MASVTSAAEIMMASSSNNQGESFNLMGLEHYSAAAEGAFEKFEHSDSKALAKILTPNDNTILHIHITAQNKTVKLLEDGDFVRRVLEKCSDLLWKVNKKGETLLHMAARHGHADVAKFLLEECKKPFQNDPELGIKATRLMLLMKNEARDTALHEAVRYSDDDLDVVKVLTEAGPELTYEANTAGETPLYLAAERGYAKVLKEILTCSSPGDHGPYDRTALHVAVIRKDEDMVEILLQAGEGIHKSKQDQHGWTPLHFAAHLGYINILNKLLSKDNSVFNILNKLLSKDNSVNILNKLLSKDNSAAYKADNKGKTALHVAAGRGRVDIMKELISKCPDCCELVDERGRNVLHFALESKKKAAVKFVLEHPLLGNLINEKDENGNTPLLHAASIEYYHMRHPKVDMQVFNHQNHNAMDIFLGNNITSEEVTKITLSRSVWLKDIWKCSQGLRTIVSENDSNIIGEGRDKGNTVRSKSNNGKEKNISIDNLMEKTRENELLVATLIATVSFTAGITVPGGFVADKGPDQGAAILTRNSAFKAFVILNAISMFFSCLAVFYHLAESIVESTATHVPGTRKLFKEMTLHQLFIILAMMAMIGAFLSGTCTVLHSDRNLAINACVVPVAVSAYLGLSEIAKPLVLNWLKMEWKLSNFLRKIGVHC